MASIDLQRGPASRCHRKDNCTGMMILKQAIFLVDTLHPADEDTRHKWQAVDHLIPHHLNRLLSAPADCGGLDHLLKHRVVDRHLASEESRLVKNNSIALR